MSFFITGLPRSRTAWFSAFMTASGFPCLHEGMNNCLTIKEYKDKVSNVSDSNTGFAFIENPYPNRPLLIIHRKGRMNGVKGMLKGSDKLKKMNGLHVNFEDIDIRIHEIFNYLTGFDLNTDIYNSFKYLKITTLKEMDIESAKVLINASNQ